MKYSSLLGYARLTIIFLVLSVLAGLIYLSRGEKMNEKLAGTICAKLIYDYIDKDFKINKSIFKYSFTFNTSKIDLLVEYSNGKKVSSSCFYKNKYSNSTIYLKNATIVDKNSKTIIFDSLKIDYKQ
jgi:hypothetical protein